MPVHRREAGLVDRTKMAGIRAMLEARLLIDGGPGGRAAYNDLLSKFDAATDVSFSCAPDCHRHGLERPLSKLPAAIHLPAKLLQRSEDTSAALLVCADCRGNVSKGRPV